MKKVKILFSIILVSFMYACTTDQRPIHILMAGDSTMADKVLYKTYTDPATGLEQEEDFPERGWGMVLPEYFKDNVVIENYAKNGRSTRTFIEEGIWEKLVSDIQKGDYVIIQFGHNDASEEKKDRYTSPEDYKKNLEKFVEESLAKGGNPILCSPVARRKYQDGKIINTHGVYPDIAAEVAGEKNIPFIDMFKLTADWLNEAGEEESARYFMNLPAGTNKLYPEGLIDNTHFVEAGAEKVAGFFVEEIKRQNINGLTKYLKK